MNTVYAVVNDSDCDFAWETEIYSTYDEAVACIDNTIKVMSADNIDCDGFEIMELTVDEIDDLFCSYVDCR